jgi:2-isopropylmalate synthase
MKTITIFDTTLRDGEQAPGFSLNSTEKLEMARQLARLGVDVMEVGFPASSPEDFESVKQIAREVGQGPTAPIICGLARARRDDIDRCWEAVKDASHARIHVFLATSEVHMKYKLRMTPEQVKVQAVEAVRYARSLCPNVEFSPEDASRSQFEFLCEVLRAVIEAGAGTINIPDTVGYATPDEWGQRIAMVRQRVIKDSDVSLSVHCHNDLGLAVANSLVAIQNGATQVECTVNGIGERAGNAALEEIVMCLQTRPDVFAATTKIERTEIYPSSKLLSQLTGKAVQSNKSIVGDNAFAHEAGIHQHGVLSNPQTYEIMRAEDIGRPSNQLVLGKHSGKHALSSRLSELGFTLDKELLHDAFMEFKRVADGKKVIYDEDLIALVSQRV